MKTYKALYFPELLENLKKEYRLTWDGMAQYIVEHGDTDNDKISRSHINSWRNGTRPEYRQIKAIATAFNLSEKNIMEICGYEGLNPTTIGNTEISEITGLSYKAIECLRMWNQDRQQATTLDGIYAHDLDTLNTILEHYYNRRKEAAKKKRWANFSVFHFISIFLNTDNFERISNEQLDDPAHIELLNTGNELERYAVPVSGLLREYAIRQIEKALKKIGGIE